MTAMWLRRFALVSLCLALLGGCDLFSADEPEEARLRIDGPSGATARLILSTNFLSQRVPIIDPVTGIVAGDSLVVNLLRADTIEATLPFDERYDISQYDQFYTRINRLVDSTSVFEAEVWVDGDSKAERDLITGQDSLVIVYNFRNRPIEREPDEA